MAPTTNQHIIWPLCRACTFALPGQFTLHLYHDLGRLHAQYARDQWTLHEDHPRHSSTRKVFRKCYGPSFCRLTLPASSIINRGTEYDVLIQAT
jgi:hypothetical protein